MYKAIPFAKKILPNLEDVFNDLEQLKEQASILEIPDRFNDLFSAQGWVAYESMNLDVMKGAIGVYESGGMEKAEQYLSESYDEDTLTWGILRFNGNPEFRRRIHYVEA